MSNDSITQARGDLIYAILALDSYDRGYGSAIFSANGGLGETGNIGNFSVRENATDILGQDAKAAGFYAIAYNDDATGQTVIAYRGTDSPFGSATSGSGDVLNGYGIALGQTNSAQGDLALKFYTAVDTAGVTDLTLTGHSLGGGLVAFVVATNNAQAALFNYMPFQPAANENLIEVERVA